MLEICSGYGYGNTLASMEIMEIPQNEFQNI